LFLSLGASRPTNRRLLNRKVVWEWREEWKILADFKAEFKNFLFLRASALKADALREHERSSMSSLLDIARTFFRKKEKF
jgi:hypothetical protein